MKITDVTLTLFAWDDIPATTYGRAHRQVRRPEPARPARDPHRRRRRGPRLPRLGQPRRAVRRAESLISSLKPLVMGQDPLDRERLYQALLAAQPRTPRARHRRGRRGAVGHRGQGRGLPIHRLLGTYRGPPAGLRELGGAAGRKQAYAEEAAQLQGARAGPPTRSIRRPTRGVDIEICEAVRKAVGDDYTVDARCHLGLRLPGGDPRRPRDRGARLLLVRGPAGRRRPLQLRQAEAEARHPDPGHRVLAGRLHRLRALDHAPAPPTSCAATSRSRAASRR